MNAAGPYFFRNSFASESEKNAATVSIPFSVAARAISIAGSTPTTFIARSLKKRRPVPSFEPMSAISAPVGSANRLAICAA